MIRVMLAKCALLCPSVAVCIPLGHSACRCTLELQAQPTLRASVPHSIPVGAFGLPLSAWILLCAQLCVSTVVVQVMVKSPLLTDY